MNTLGNLRLVATKAFFWIAGSLAISPAVYGQEAPTPRFGLLGLHGGVFEEIESIAGELQVQVDALDEQLLSDATLDWSMFDAVLIQHLRGDDQERCEQALLEARRKNPKQIVFSISGSLEHRLPKLTADRGLEHDPRMRDYYRASGRENMRRLLAFVLVTKLGREGEVLPPLEPPTGALYHPDHGGPFADVDAFLAWSRERVGSPEGAASRVAVAVHRIHRGTQQPRVVAALVKALEARGLVTVVIEDNAPDYRETLKEFEPAVVLHTCHSFDDVGFRQELGVPHLHSIFFRRQSIEEWKSSTSGLDASTMAFQITSQELLGAIEPQVGAGTLRGRNSAEDLKPIPERIEHLANRALAWVRLGRLPNPEKKVAILYYNREMGKSDLMRGSATGMFLNAPRSLLRVLDRMKEEGYALAPLPSGEDELLGRMMDHGQQIGAWAPEELDRIARSGKAVLIPSETYRAWFEAKVPSARRQELIERWGPPPGRIQVWERKDGQKFLVLPRVDMGSGVSLMPQPLRGEAHDTSLAHDRLVPPSHNYLATYFWLQEEFRADALIHFGTHGTEFLLPGKASGLAGDDWTDLVLGNVPNITPWVVNNLGESSPARRRAYAVLINHLVPPSVNAGLSDGLLRLHDCIDKWQALQDGALREKFRTFITKQVVEENLDRDLHLEGVSARLLSPQEIDEVSVYLHDITNETTPVSLHTLGEAPPEELLVPYLVTCLGSSFLDALGEVVDVPSREDRFGGDRDKYLRKCAEEVIELLVKRGLEPVEAIVAAGGQVGGSGLSEELRDALELAQRLSEGFAKTGQEVENLLAALDGRFIPPGPGNSPDRNPGVLPTGRNMYLLNPEEIPSRPSWELGKALIDELLAQQLETRKRLPRKVGFTLNSFATFQDYGVMEAQIPYLLGVRPVWDSRNLVAELELIPRFELGRPRIDVFVSMGSYYRDMLPSRLRLLDRAVRLVAALDEDGNSVFENSVVAREELTALGVAPENADMLSRARLFGYPPGQMGSAGYYYLVERSGEWDTPEDLVNTYLEHVRYVYTDGLWGEHSPEGYDRQIQGTEVILRSWSDRTRSPLSNKYDWYKAGSLSRAVAHLTGSEPEFLFSDVRDADRAQMVNAEEALRREYRVRLFNRKWIEGMMGEGFAGADQIAKHVSNTMGWAIMREAAVGDDIWEQIVETFVDDRLELGLREWFEDENPFAYQEMTEIMLESIRKGYWDADAEMRVKLAQEYAASVARHGDGGGMLGGGNEKLDAFVEQLAAAPGEGDAADLQAEQQPSPDLRNYQEGATASAPDSAEGPQVRGHALEPVQEHTPATSTSEGQVSRTKRIALLAALLLLIVGCATRYGVPRA